MQSHRTKVNPQAITSGSVGERGFTLATAVRLHRQRGPGMVVAFLWRFGVYEYC